MPKRVVKAMADLARDAVNNLYGFKTYPEAMKKAMGEKPGSSGGKKRTSGYGDTRTPAQRQSKGVSYQSGVEVIKGKKR
jgi:hypothetical protein